MVSTLDFVISILLVLLALWTIAWLGFSFLSPLFSIFQGSKSHASSQGFTPSNSSFGGFFERWRFRQCVKALEEVEKALISENISLAKGFLPRALYMEWIRYSPELVGKGASHQLELLNKLIIIAELEGGTIRNLPKLETLFAKRGEIITSAFETQIGRTRFIKKQREKGRNAPPWSTKEFDTRIADLRQQLKQLHSEARAELLHAIRDISKSSLSKDSGASYH